MSQRINAEHCPFCGANDARVYNRKGYIYIFCGRCDCFGPSGYDEKLQIDTVAMALKRWNRRAAGKNKKRREYTDYGTKETNNADRIRK